MRPPPTFAARLASARALSPSVRSLVFERTDGAPVVFEAGQWVTLVIPGAKEEIRRSYSIASPPAPSPRFEIAVTRVDGPGSTFLHGLPLGSELVAIGPQGFFTRPLDRAPPSLFVATGTGVTPFRSMLAAAVDARATTPTWLLFGVRHEADVLYRDELEALAAAHPNVRLEVTLSQPPEAWTGRRGYVQTHVPGLLAALAAQSDREPHVYACGLTRMITSVRDLLRRELALPRERVHTERYD